MLKPDEVEAMLGLYELGWGTRRIAEEFGCSRNTVKRYVQARGMVRAFHGNWATSQPFANRAASARA